MIPLRMVRPPIGIKAFIHPSLPLRSVRVLSRTSRSEPLVDKDRIVTIPNLLCGTRIAVSPYICYLIEEGNYPLALACFGYAGFTDLADGLIARNFKGQASSFGSFLDPLADKILVTCLYLSLTNAGPIPACLTALVISRDLLLVYAGLYIRYLGVEPPFTFRKYVDVRLPLAQIKPPLVSKVNTIVQLALIGSALTSLVLGLENHPLVISLMAITACTTFASSVSYAFARDTYRFSNRSYDHQFTKKILAFMFFIGFNAIFTYNYPPTFIS